MKTDKPAILGGKVLFPEKLPLVRPLLPSLEEIKDDLSAILSSKMVTKGSYLQRFEHALQEFLDVKNAVCVSSCTSGLMLTLKAFGLRGEVIIPSFTFMASGTAVIWAKLDPVLVDVDPNTMNIDPNKVEDAITSNTCAILGVHTFGNPADVDALETIAKRKGIKVIYDSAHAFGSLHHGKRLGGFGDAEVFSMSPTKLLVAGEGGVVTTNDAEIANKIRILREYGNRGDYGCDVAGINARMSEFHACIGLWSLQRVENSAISRNKVASIYKERLSKLKGVSFQNVRPYDRSSYKDFAVIIKDCDLSRDQVARALAFENIDFRFYYDPPLHRMEAFANAKRKDISVSEELSKTILCLPIYSEMDDEIVDRVCLAFERIFLNADDVRRACHG